MRLLLPGWLAFPLALLFSACRPASSIATPNPTATQTPAPAASATLPVQSGPEVREETLRGTQVTVWHPWFGAEASLFQSQVAQFNTDNPWGIVVLIQPQGNFTELFDAVSGSLTSSQRPDVIVALPEQTLVWDRESVVLDLTPYLSDPFFGLAENELSDFPSLFLAGDALDGRRLGMPAQRTGRFLLYNQTWARQLGFDTAPATADDFAAQTCAANRFMRSDALPDNDGQGGWLVDAHPMTALAWMQAFNGGLLARDGYRFLTHPNLNALTFIKNLYDRGCAWMPSDGNKADHFSTRRALLITASLDEFFEVVQAFTRAGNDDEWTVLAFPGTNGSNFLTYGSSYVILKSEDTRQLAAWLFVRWMLSPENQARWVKSTGLFPLRASMMQTLQDYGREHPQWQAAVELLPVGQVPPQIPTWRKARPMVGDAFLSIFRLNTPTGQLSAVLARMDGVLRDLQTDLDK